MFRNPAVLPADLATFGAHDTARQAAFAPPPPSPPAFLSPSPDEVPPDQACWGLLAVLLVLDERTRSGATPPVASPSQVGSVSDGPDSVPAASLAVKGAAAVQAPGAFKDPDYFEVDAESSPEPLPADANDPPPPFHLLGPHPFEIPELRELILNHVPVDLTFNASVLRVNRAFYGHFHPRFYRSINLTGPSRQPIKFLESLEARPTETLDAISIGSLLFRLRDDDRTEDFLRRLGKLLRRSAPFAKAIKSLSVFLTCPEDPDDNWEDASQLADVVAACPGLGRLILKQWVTHEFYNSLCGRLLACHPTAVLKRLEDLVVEIPAEPFLFRARHVLPSPPKVKTIRTLLVPPVAAAAPELSVHLLSLLLGWLDGNNKFEAQTLVIGSGLMTWLSGKSSSALNQLEIALAQRLVKERGSDLGCRVVWPKSLDLAALLDRDPVFQEVGLMGTVDLWRENVWPEIWPRSSWTKGPRSSS